MTPVEVSPRVNRELYKSLWMTFGIALLHQALVRGADIRVEGIDKLKLIGHQKEPIVFFSNHSSQDDPAAQIETYRHCGKKKGPWIIPHSHHHALTDPLYGRWVDAFSKLGFTMPPVEQSYRLRIAEGSTPVQEDAEEHVGLTKQDMGMMLSSYARTYFYPEGHRSYGELNPAEELIGMLARMAKINVLFVPIAFYNPTESHSRRITLHHGLIGKKPSEYKMIVGDPLSKDQLIELAKSLATTYGIDYQGNARGLIAHAAMIKVRDLLPEHMHGVYAKNNPSLRDVLVGDVKLGVRYDSTQNGEVVLVRRCKEANTGWRMIEDQKLPR